MSQTRMYAFALSALIQHVQSTGDWVVVVFPGAQEEGRGIQALLGSPDDAERLLRSLAVQVGPHGQMAGRTALFRGGGRLTVARGSQGVAGTGYHVMFLGFDRDLLPSDEIALHTWRQSSLGTIGLGERSGEDEGLVSHRQLWIFHVIGGETFRMNPKGNLSMHHDGDMSILRCLCTAEEAAAITAEMEALGCTVKSNCPMETPEQNAERKNIMQVIGGDRPFPCLKCPECAWFDPHLDSLCGAGFVKGNGWDDDAVEGSMSNEKFRDDFAACPLRKEQVQ